MVPVRASTMASIRLLPGVDCLQPSQQKQDVRALMVSERLLAFASNLADGFVVTPSGDGQLAISCARKRNGFEMLNASLSSLALSTSGYHMDRHVRPQ